MLGDALASCNMPCYEGLRVGICRQSELTSLALNYLGRYETHVLAQCGTTHACLGWVLVSCIG